MEKTLFPIEREILLRVWTAQQTNRPPTIDCDADGSLRRGLLERRYIFMTANVISLTEKGRAAINLI